MGPVDNPGRERILARMRQALTVPSAKHSGSSERKQIFPTIVDPLARFQKECEENKTECVVVADRKASANAIAEVLASLPTGEVFVQDSPALREMAASWPPAHHLRWSTEGAPSEASQATITHAEELVAATGSILVSAACAGRGASVVAPVHMVVASIDQLAPDLEATFARQRERGTILKNTFLCLITGSSRTADIEKILVMGAHGPRRLVVVLLLQDESNCGDRWQDRNPENRK
jgi:L-lactate dehydrogenase complex protein LldG